MNATEHPGGRNEGRTARAHVRPGDTPRRRVGADPHATNRAFRGLVGADVLSLMTEAAPHTARPARRTRPANHRRRTVA